MRFVTKHQDLTLVLRPSDRIMVGAFQRFSKPIRAHFKGIGQGEFDTDVAARRFNWTPEEKRYAEEALLTHNEFNVNGGFQLEPGQDLPDWALEMAPAESLVDMVKAAGNSCQFVLIDEAEGKAEGCSLQAISEDVPYCMKHALDSGYEVSVSKPEPEPVREPEDQTAPAMVKTRPRNRRREAATA